MINPQTLDIHSLPSLPLSKRKSLPSKPAIYLAIDSQGTIQYIGRSVDLKTRWNNHHRYKQLKDIGKVRIAYIDCPEYLLESVEKALIEYFNPVLNGHEVPKKFREETHFAFRRTKQINEFIQIIWTARPDLKGQQARTCYEALRHYSELLKSQNKK